MDDNNDYIINTDDIVIEKSIIQEKSPEELKAYMIDENLNDLSKAILMLNDQTNEFRCLIAIKMIPNLLINDKYNCIEKLFPKLKNLCFDYYHSNEFYDQISDTFEYLLVSCLITPREFSSIFLDPLRKKIFDSDDSDEIILTWISIFLRIIALLPNNIVKTSIFETYMSLSKKYNYSQNKRKYMCILLGKCSIKIDELQLNDYLIPFLIDYCDDTSYEVRATACTQLSTFSHLINTGTFTHTILPELIKLVCDETSFVKIACLNTLVEYFLVIDDISVKQIILEKIQFLIDFGFRMREELFVINISKNIGKIFQSIDSLPDTRDYFVGIFQNLCKDNYSFARRPLSDMRTLWKTCKINIIEHLPAIIRSLMDDKDLIKTKILATLSDLAHDRDEKVKESLLSQIIRIGKSLGSPMNQLIIKDFCDFFIDDSFNIKTKCSQILKEFLNLYIKSTSNGVLNDNSFVYSDEILNKILKFEEDLSKTYKYNIHENILLSFEQLPWLICTDELVDRVLPVLDSRLSSRALPIRLASIQSMLKILRKIPRLQIRNQYLIKLLEFSHQTSCYKRIMFIDVCRLAYELYSKDFFKEWFYENLIRMATDDVTNIKIALIKLLFNLKKLFNSIQEKEKLNYLERQVENLLRDKDKDVRDLAEKLIIHGNFLDEIKIRPYHVNECDKEKNLLKEKEEKELKEIESKKIKGTAKQGHITYFQQQEVPKVKPRSTKISITSRPANTSNTQSAKVTLKERKSANINGIFDENLKNATRRNSLNNDNRTNMTKEFKINKK